MHGRTQQLLVLLIGLNVAAISVCAGLFVWIRHTTLETVRLGGELSRQAVEEASFRSAARLVVDTEMDRNELREYVVSEAAVVDIITLLESLGESAGVVEFRVLSIAPLSDTDAGGIHPLSVRIEADGSWSAMFHLLSLIESLPRAAFVESVSLAHRLAGTAGEAWHGSVTVVVLVSADAPGQ